MMYGTELVRSSKNQNKTTMYLGLGLGQKRSEKKDGLPSQSGRGRTGKY